MKAKQIIGTSTLCIYIFLSCTNSNPPENNTQINNETLLKKELELTKKELELSKKEAALDNNKSKIEKPISDKNNYKQEPASKPESTKINYQSDPKSVVQLIFDAAKSGNLSELSDLCSPTCDGDTKGICSISSQTFYAKKEFIEYFKFGKIISEPIIIDDRASIKFKFGPDGTKEEEMNLIKINDKWYLYSF
jgi:hypothetical protein